MWLVWFTCCLEPDSTAEATTFVLFEFHERGVGQRDVSTETTRNSREHGGQLGRSVNAWNGLLRLRHPLDVLCWESCGERRQGF